jgi:precorrin-6y C5,15-methyltransferase (decarboxylating) CbiE subunit
LDLFKVNGCEKVPVGADVDRALKEIAGRMATKRIGLLVSGDPGLCSLAKLVIKRFGVEACRVIPGISSIQLAFARVGLDWYGAKIITAHGSSPEVKYEELAGEGKIAVLGGREESIGWISGLVEFLDRDRELIICENLSLPSERVFNVKPQKFKELKLSSMAIVLIISKELVP